MSAQVFSNAHTHTHYDPRPSDNEQNESTPPTMAPIRFVGFEGDRVVSVLLEGDRFVSVLLEGDRVVSVLYK